MVVSGHCAGVVDLGDYFVGVGKGGKEVAQAKGSVLSLKQDLMNAQATTQIVTVSVDVVVDGGQ